MLDQLEELLVRESVDTTDPETVALLEEISAEVHAIRRRINSYNPPKSFHLRARVRFRGHADLPVRPRAVVSMLRMAQ